MNQPQKNNKLKLQVSTLTIRTLETKAAPISSVGYDMKNGEACGSCDNAFVGKVAAVAYY